MTKTKINWGLPVVQGVEIVVDYSIREIPAHHIGEIDSPVKSFVPGHKFPFETGKRSVKFSFHRVEDERDMDVLLTMAKQMDLRPVIYPEIEAINHASFQVMEPIFWQLEQRVRQEGKLRPGHRLDCLYLPCAGSVVSAGRVPLVPCLLKYRSSANQKNVVDLRLLSERRAQKEVKGQMVTKRVGGPLLGHGAVLALIKANAKN